MQLAKLVNLLSSTDRLERANLLLQIRLNHLVFDHTPADAGTMFFENFLAELQAANSLLYQILEPGGEADGAVEIVRSAFKERTAEQRRLPFPTFYNADRSLALLTYALARHLRPDFTLESGVGYGITSALVLLAMERNNCGNLLSIDLPPLSDPLGSFTGLVVSPDLRKRWSLRLGSSRLCLPEIVSRSERIDLFISDSANVYTLQRFEFETVWPKLRPSGVALFNNIGSKFQAFLRSVGGIDYYSIWQVDKPKCATGLIVKKDFNASPATWI